MEKLGIESKKLMSEEIKEMLKSQSDLFITSFHSMNVSEQEQLRQKLEEIGASLQVVKNRIAKHTLKQLNLEILGSTMQGLTAIAMGGDDSLSTSKALVGFMGKNEGFKILGGYIDKQVLDRNSIKRLASIPSKEMLLVQIFSGLKSPIQGLVNSLSGTIKKFVIVLDKIKEKGGKV